MLKWLVNKLFLVKTIREQNGALHFMRWRLLALPWFRIYLHKICLPDYDLQMHDHPWSFKSLILKGSYYERYRVGPRYGMTYNMIREPGDVITHHRSDVHQLEEVYGEVWTLVFAYGKYQTWGYRFRNPDDGNRFTKWVDHITYRKMKNAGEIK